MHRAKFLLNHHFSFIHSNITYGNIVWGSTSKTKLRKYSSIRKKAPRVYFLLTVSLMPKTLMLDMNALNVYQINKYQNLILLYIAHIGTAPSLFFNKFSTINHNYPTIPKNSRIIQFLILQFQEEIQSFGIQF